MTNEKLHDRLRKMKAMAERAAGNEAEAQAFAAKLQEMMMQHNLEMSDVEWEKEVREKAVEALFHPHHCSDKIPKWARSENLAFWAIDLARIIATANSSRILLYTSWSKKVTGIAFVGLEGNAQTCFETMKYLYPAAVMISQREYDRRYNELYLAKQDTTPVKGYKTSFLIGFTQRLAERFKENADAIRSAMAGCAMIRLTDAIKVADQYITDLKIDKTGKKISIARPSITNTLGYQDGKRRASDMNIGGASLAPGRKETPNAKRLS